MSFWPSNPLNFLLKFLKFFQISNYFPAFKLYLFFPKLLIFLFFKLFLSNFWFSFKAFLNGWNFLALFQCFFLSVCGCAARLVLWVLNIPYISNCYCSYFFICRESVYFRRIEPVSTALRSFLRWITCTLRRLFTVTWRWTLNRAHRPISTFSCYDPQLFFLPLSDVSVIGVCYSSWKTWCWIRTVT